MAILELEPWCGSWVIKERSTGREEEFSSMASSTEVAVNDGQARPPLAQSERGEKGHAR